MKRFAVVLMLVSLAASAAGCTSKPAMTSQKSGTIEASATSTAAPVAKKGPLASQEIVDAFKAADLPVGKVIIYDAENDPNSLLGRPGQYTAKFNFADTRLDQSGDDVVGGSIESFATEADAKQRVEYLQSVIKSMPNFTEYEYTNGLMVLRLDKGLTPDQAKAYDKVFQGLGK